MRADELPEGWEWISLGNVADYINGRAFKPSDWGEIGLPIIRIQNLNNPNSEYNYFNGEYESKFEVNKGDILLSWSGTPGTSFGVFIWKGGKAVLNQHIFNVKFKKENINKKFFQLAVNSKLYLLIAKAHGGVGLRHITKKDLIKIKIPLPLLETQKKLVAILEKAEQLQRLQVEVDKQFDELVKSIFIDMFGDPVTNPKGWDVKTLEELCSLIKDGPHVSPKYSEKGVPFLTGHNINKGYLDMSDIKYISEEDHLEYSKRTNPKYGDVLYTKGGITGIAKRVNWDFKFNIWVHIALLQFSKETIMPEFLESCLNSNYCYAQSQKYTRGIANRDLVIKQMKRIKIIVPSIELQKKFSLILHNIEDNIVKCKKSNQNSNTLFNSLIQKAFKGELIK